jgi:patatin-like phospholipase/acyl hydrolase
MSDLLKARLQSANPKKILCCDGGGIRGLASVEILAKIEADLRTQLKKDASFVLADYFDFVCGTSTGAIIATCISAGMSVDEVRRFYVDNGKQMFDKTSIFNRLHYKYDDEPLAKILQTALNKRLQTEGEQGHVLLGNNNLKTLLMLVLRNHTTDSPWFVSNNPYAKYNDTTRDDCNLELPLWQLVRASTAAPTFFPPEVVEFGKQKKYQFIFVDGGVTTYNNPAFMAFQTVTATPYGINWQTGEQKMLIVSIGTGSAPNVALTVKGRNMDLLYNAAHVPNALMDAATAGWDMTCRTLGRCRFGRKIDSEFGDMVQKKDHENWTGKKLFTYLRYDPDLSQSGINELGLATIKAEQVLMLDAVENIGDLQKIGKKFSEAYVDTATHFEGFY